MDSAGSACSAAKLQDTLRRDSRLDVLRIDLQGTLQRRLRGIAMSVGELSLRLVEEGFQFVGRRGRRPDYPGRCGRRIVDAERQQTNLHRSGSEVRIVT